MTPPDHLRWAGAVAVLVAMTALAVAGPPVAAQSATEPAFVVQVHADGAATVSLRATFDLETDAERRAFETLMDDDQAQADAKARFLDRMRAVASDAENATGRAMSVTDATIELRRTDDNRTGVVRLSVAWSGLAEGRGDTLVVTEPFASGFNPDRPFVLHAPDGYEIASASPEPDALDGRTATWDAGTDLTGFAVELQPVPTPSPTATTEPPADEEGTTRTGGQPGFGVLPALVALVAAGAAGIRRARRH